MRFLSVLWLCYADDLIFFVSRPGTVLTVQALSEDDHKFWMQAMGGKEPVSWLCSMLLCFYIKCLYHPMECCWYHPLFLVGNVQHSPI